ncbi:MAG: DUF1257 domain-containing protein [Anaerolineaceae bacterium]|nr:DUF1257 domain-containing protein [Anaerolineaceae bacterium]
MSKYKLVQTEFRNGASLKLALDDLKIHYSAGVLNQNSQTLKTEWLMHDSHQSCAIAVQADDIRKVRGFGFGGIGFSWTGKGYDLIADVHDNNDETITKLRQRYAFHEVSRQARAKGYTIRETTTDSGVIRMTLVKR